MGRLVNYFCFYILLFHVGAFAQAVKNQENRAAFDQKVTEKTHLDLNTDVILTGENLLYKVTVPSEVEKDSLNQSKIAYVRLIDDTNQTWLSDKIILSDKSGSGSYKIPVEAKSGNYKLISYTNWSRNNRDSGYFVKDILVINPFFLTSERAKATPDSGYVLSKKDNNTIIPEKSTDKITIHLDKTVYGPRELVNIDIKVPQNEKIGNYLLSVRKVAPVKSQRQIPKKQLSIANENRAYLPEFRGELLSGNILTKNPKWKTADKTISLSIPGRHFLFKNVKTDRNGKFLFLLDKPYSSTNGIIQVIDKNSGNYQVQLDENDPKLFDRLNFKRLKVDPALKEWLEQRSIDIQIMNAYTETLPPTAADSIPNDLFYTPFATRYRLDDYDRFPTMHETFTEIIWDAAMRVDPDQVRLKVYNTENPFNDGLDKIDPLVLIDGIQIQDNFLVENLDPNTVAYIDVVPEQYRYGPCYFSGIISIVTKNHGFTLPNNENGLLKFNLPLPIKGSDYVQKSYTAEKEYKRIPDYRTQLYWNANLQFKNKQQKQIQFYTSDRKGIYDIILKGYNNSGESIEAKKRFSVKAP